MRQKRFLAVLLAATLALGSSVTAFAGTVSSQEVTGTPVNGSMKGTSRLEGLVDTDVFIVDVPTKPEKRSPLSFIMDPQNLIEKTQGAKYATSNTNMTANRDGISTNSISYNSLYFVNMTSTNTIAGLSASSDALMIKNKGTNDISVKAVAKVTKLGNISMSTNDNVSGNTAPTLYLALAGEDVSGNAGGTNPVSDNVASMTQKISGCDAAYEVSINSANEYGYKLSSNDVDFDGYGFRLTGTCGGGSYADWAAIQKAKTEVNVEVTWNIVPYVDSVPPVLTPNGSITKPSSAPFAVEIGTISLGQGSDGATGFEITFVNANGVTRTLDATNYEITEDGVLKIKSSYVSGLTTTTSFTLTFNNESSTSVPFTITVS